MKRDETMDSRRETSAMKFALPCGYAVFKDIENFKNFRDGDIAFK